MTNQEFCFIDEFSYVIQSLKGLKTLELEGRQTKWYLDIMVNNIRYETDKTNHHQTDTRRGDR
jgi:hypothetical protein